VDLATGIPNIDFESIFFNRDVFGFEIDS